MYPSLRWFSVLLLSCVGATAPGHSQAPPQAEVLLAEYREIANARGMDAVRLRQLFGLAEKRDGWEDAPATGVLSGAPARWWSNAPERVEARRAMAIAARSAIRSIDRSALPREDQLNYDLFLWQADVEADRLSFPTEYLPIGWRSGVHRWTGWVTAKPTRSVAEYEEVLSWLRGVALRVDEDIAWMREGLRHGVTQPREMLREEAEEIRKHAVGDALTSPYLRAFVRFPSSIREAEQVHLRAAAVRVYEQEVRPAYERLDTFLTREYLPQARESVSASTLPRGRDWYAERVRSGTSSNLSPEELHRIGLVEMRRAQAEIDSIRRKVGFQGAYPDFIRFVTTDPQFLFSDSAGLIHAVEELTGRIDPLLSRVSRQPSRLSPYVIQAVPRSEAANRSIGSARRGSRKDGRPGVYYLNTYKLGDLQRWKLESLTLHEAVPGHLFEFGWREQLESLPAFRRNSSFGAFSEGWAMYAETLGPDLGLYRDPYARLGFWNARLTRALRLVVETGIHVHGWTREEAIRFWQENGTGTHESISLEVSRAIANPGWIIQHMVGALTFERLREQAERELGSRFDARDFHDALLGNGPLPLALLEAEIDRWVSERKHPAQR